VGPRTGEVNCPNFCKILKSCNDDDIQVCVRLVKCVYLTSCFLVLSCKMSAMRHDGGRCRSSHLRKGKAVVYATTIPPNTDDEYDAMEASLECVSH
jgi:hypothetical protein